MARGDDEAIKRIPPQPKAPPEPLVEGGSDPAEEEAKQLTRGLDRRDLKKEAEEADHERSQKFKDIFEKMALGAVIALYIGFLFFSVVWGIHILAPQWGWLTADQLEKVQGLLTGGIIAGLVSDHVKKRLD